MQTSQPTESFSANPGALQVRQNDCASVTNDDVLYVSGAVYEDSDLPI